ncbi:DNA methyltransferase [Nostoc sp. 'Peltigera membranacea cyanobiont' 210A]|uniref:type I restriction-modification system subunit M n=1 Tax=Nostoc sp. 'Peltigera membranacea cyanobiont' 210A TaxID=2014529 RepID=UPI000B951C42|nr:class I SAM-dependent DNA methyltransferase [Nostoc sp. 'Peltigera membranacea cyanobiont' 210A]OYD96888.1 DNA methyltransferase [Nostoc sp. 'Peltigera membranacea cyanobiont' 210A]
MLNISQLESSLWEAADQLRANSKLNANEYSMPVLGLIFLRHATNRFNAVKAEIEKGLSSRGGKKRPITIDDFKGKSAIFLPVEAQYDRILNLAENADIGKAINAAMKAIEDETKMLEGVLPKEYTSFEQDLLYNLVRIFDREELRTATGDVFGRIYEYFLNKFAMSGAQEGGEFFTPPSLVRTIVNMIEPDRGNVLDPACGSAGMFVQTGHFVENRGEDAAAKITFYGQEKSDTNTRLARMNLAVHGLEGIIRQGNTFYDRWEELLGQCDFVMSNPPFNVDGVSPEKVKTDSRLFTEKKIPGIAAKTKAVSNANYLWIQYFYSYLNERGRAGFVMASSASDAGHGEKEIREELIATQAVDMIISIGTNFFYTKSLPCTLWFFDKGKPAERQDKVLMIDARNVYRVVTRKIRDFSEEQLQNITAIAWLYRGQQERYLGLVGDYLNKTHQEAGTIAGVLTQLESPLVKLTQMLQTFSDSLGASLPLLKDLPEVEGLVAEDIANQNIETFRATLSELEAGIQEFTAARVGLIGELQVHLAWFASQAESLSTNEAQKECAARFAQFIPQLKTLQKHINEVHKLASRAVELAEKKLEARKQDVWDGKEVKKQRDALDILRDEAIFAIKSTLYVKAQVTWLQSRFPEAVFVDVSGLCKVVTRDEITQQDSSLTPGRYVGVTALDGEDEEDFEERMREIHLELASLNEEAVELAASIAANFEELTIIG